MLAFDAANVFENVPATQLVHEAEPIMLAYDPAGHCWHVDMAIAEAKVPTAQ